MGQLITVPLESSLKMILLALSFSVLGTVSATTTTMMSESGYGYGSGCGYGSEFDGYGSSIFNDTWGSGSGYGGYGGYGGYWPEDIHCCMMKSVGDKKYQLVDYQEAEGWKKEGDLYCFGRGRMDVKCYDDHMGGYGSGSMGGYGSGSMGSGYGSGSMGSGSGSMGSGYGMGSGMESGYGYGSEGYGPGGYGSDFSSTSPSS